jgi:23S rRNA (cytidine1920-2'-O)/16S rRNA (cytidine1409-2'-O)-methyltransferase
MSDDKNTKQSNRLDVETARRGLARSRSEAADLISRKKVSVNGKISSKASMEVSPDDNISVDSPSRYVSRAGEKLSFALSHFQIDPTGLDAIDIGSSTGGFTDCLLRSGAKHVTAIDVGKNQFAKELRGDARVILHESTDVRRFTTVPVDLVVIDVSFISLSLVLPKAFEFLKPSCSCIALVKPQFEVGMELAKKFQGVILDNKLQSDMVDKIKSCALSLGFKIAGDAPSPIEGEKGNREFLLLLKK